jgi:hypothetical protein
MDPEEREVKNERYGDQPECTGSEMTPEVFLETDELVMRGLNKQTLTMDEFFRMSKRSHKSTRTATPMVTTVSTPFTLEPQAHAMKIPVAIIQPHHSGVNDL